MENCTHQRYSAQINLKDVIFDKAEFNINKFDLNFFSNFLNISPIKDNLIIKNSSLFFKDEIDTIFGGLLSFLPPEGATTCAHP